MEDTFLWPKVISMNLNTLITDCMANIISAIIIEMSKIIIIWLCWHLMYYWIINRNRQLWRFHIYVTLNEWLNIAYSLVVQKMPWVVYIVELKAFRKMHNILQIWSTRHLMFQIDGMWEHYVTSDVSFTVNNPIPANLKSEAKKAAKILREFTEISNRMGPDKLIPGNCCRCCCKPVRKQWKIICLLVMGIN